MPTVVVSGRVDEGVKLHADAIIRAAGSTVNGVINDVWQTIVSTGQIPAPPAAADEQVEKRAAFASFMEWFNELPPQNEAYEGMTDDEILAGRVDDYA